MQRDVERERERERQETQEKDKLVKSTIQPMETFQRRKVPVLAKGALTRERTDNLTISRLRDEKPHRTATLNMARVRVIPDSVALWRKFSFIR